MSSSVAEKPHTTVPRSAIDPHPLPETSAATSFLAELRAIILPRQKWHYAFHLAVMFVAASYWIASLVKLPEASWAETIMYRPAGDNEVYPLINELSKFNFGDPTDAIHYGKGVSGARVIALLPYALACAVFGNAGYLIGDVAVAWLNFVAIVLLLRRCSFGQLASLLLGSALATHSLQVLFAKIGEAFAAFLSLFGLGGTWEWGFPNLMELHILVDRIPRPMVTEIFMLLLLYFLIRQWHERTLPTLKRGFAMGSLLVLLMQADPFILSALGLVFLWVMGWTLAGNRWRIPWRFVIGSVVGAVCFGSIFLYQRFFEHPDCTVRLGMADYPRDHLLPLPGYGPLLRVAVVCALGALVVFLDRRLKSEGLSAMGIDVSSKTNRRGKNTETNGIAISSAGSAERSLATICAALVIAGWLAQPVQLLLLGKGAEIYHYLINVLPSLYSYAFIILLFTMVRLAMNPEWGRLMSGLAQKPRWVCGLLLTMILGAQSVLGAEGRIRTSFTLGTSRQESNAPWSEAGNSYRPAFRGLDHEFRTNPLLKQTRSFATLCYEVNFLLTGFHDKRAYLPDNGYSTLSDEELEDRLCETMKIIQLKAEDFPHLVQLNFILNYWLGCAKYWLTSDHQYSTKNDYPPELWTQMEKQAKESPWALGLPNSEMQRLSDKYVATLKRESDRSKLPDAIIMSVERQAGLIPRPDWYNAVYTNDVFWVFVKKQQFTLGELNAPTSQVDN